MWRYLRTNPLILQKSKCFKNYKKYSTIFHGKTLKAWQFSFPPSRRFFSRRRLLKHLAPLQHIDAMAWGANLQGDFVSAFVKIIQFFPHSLIIDSNWMIVLYRYFTISPNMLQRRIFNKFLLFVFMPHHVALLRAKAGER
jgi:hypothetical protein